MKRLAPEFELDNTAELEAAVILPPPNRADGGGSRVRQKPATSDPAGVPTLHHWRGGWWEWRTARWVEVEQRAMAGVRLPVHRARRLRDLGRPEEGDGRQAVGAEPAQDRRPARRARRDRPPARGRLDADLARRDERTTGCSSRARTGCSTSTPATLLEHTPLFFNATSVPFAYDPSATPPVRWLTLPRRAWPGDPESGAALQEWFGYVISGRLDLHKILLLVGPTRAGKGVIARMLGALSGTRTSPARRCPA